MSSESVSSAVVSENSPRLGYFQDADRVGVFASVLCAIHCIAAPFFILLLPTFGSFWAHPASHWGMALIVVPIAAFMMVKGYKRHRRMWIIAAGVLGIFFVLTGAVAPSFAGVQEDQFLGDSAALSEAPGCGMSSCELGDACCPSVVTLEDGSQTLKVPAASILTTLGGFFLVVTHIGNLRQCSCGQCSCSEEL